MKFRQLARKPFRALRAVLLEDEPGGQPAIA